MTETLTDRREKEARRIARSYAHRAVSAEDRRYLESYGNGEYMTPDEVNRVHVAADRAADALISDTAIDANVDLIIAIDALESLAEYTGPR